MTIATHDPTTAHTNGKPPASQPKTERIAAHILTALEAINETPGAVFELSIARNWRGKLILDKGYFSDRAALALEAAKQTLKPVSVAVYVNLQRIDPDCLARAHNKISDGAKPMTGADVTRYTRFLIDVDRAGVKGISATDAEKRQILDDIEAIQMFLQDRGWPDQSFWGDSGNGYHIAWELDLPPTKENQDLLKRCYQALQQKFGSDTLSIDASLADPNQLIKLYGTMTRKGDDTTDRPHRFSKLLNTYETEPVTLEQLQALAALYVPPATGKTGKSSGKRIYWKAGTPEAVETWAEGHGLTLGPRTADNHPQTGDGHKWRVDCLTSDEHTDGAVIILNGSGYLKYRCHHNGCSDKTETDVLELHPAPKRGKKDAGASGEDEGGEEKKPKQSVLLYQMALGLAGFFTAGDGEAYALVPIDERRECHRIRMKGFRNFLASAFYEQEGTIPSVTAVQEALSLLEWEAQEERREVFVRVAGHDGKIYIDLGTPAWDAVEVDSQGWRVVTEPPVAFRRSRSISALPTPTAGGDLDTIRSLLNINAEDWPLVGAWALAALQPHGPYPILCLVGEQGTAKSSTVRALKSLIDPSIAGLRGQPEDIRDLMIAANNNWLLAYDNISYLSNDVSDALCRLATGGGYAKRSLYTDDEEFVIDATRPVVMNGITEIINRPDLLDRAILIELPILSSTKRKPEGEYWAEFEEMRPAVFGALLDALSFAMGSLPYVKLDHLPRMADFAKLGTAAWGLFYSGDDKTFLDLYGDNRGQGTESIVESSPLAAPLKSLVAIDGEWTGTTTELLEAIEKYATDRQKEAKSWPAAPNKLTSELKRLAPSLRIAGVVDARHERSNKGGKWTVKRINGK